MLHYNYQNFYTRMIVLICMHPSVIRCDVIWCDGMHSISFLLNKYLHLFAGSDMHPSVMNSISFLFNKYLHRFAGSDTHLSVMHSDQGVPIIPTNIFSAGASAMLSLSLNISKPWRWVVVARGVNVFGDSVKGEMVLVNPGPNPFVPLRQPLPRSDDDDDFSAQKEEKPKQV